MLYTIEQTTAKTLISVAPEYATLTIRKKISLNDCQVIDHFPS
jgi:hypothetical protein